MADEPICVFDPREEAPGNAAPVPEDADFFHTRTWVRILSDVYGYQPFYLRTTDAPGAVLPLMQVCSRLTGTRGVSLPFTDRCEPTGTRDQQAQLVERALQEGRTRKWRYVEFRGELPLAPSVAPSCRYHRHVLSLTTGESALLAGCSASHRRAIRKAEQNELVIVQETSPAAIRAFYGLVQRTRQRQGVPPQPYRFYASIALHALATGAGHLILARHQGRAVAGALFLHHGRRAIYKFGASDDAFQSLRGNHLVMWSAICWYARQGYETLDFGRTSMGQDGLRQFKLGWGAHELVLPYYRYDLTKNAWIGVPDQAHGWHNRIFQRLPRQVSRLIGTLLYPHMG